MPRASIALPNGLQKPKLGRVQNDEEAYDAILLVSFGGPEGPDDVLPFLENVTAGRGIPKERLIEVGAHYDHFGGKSPINDHCRSFLVALKKELRREGVELPVYWGNRNWHPMLEDTIRQMRDDGVQRALAFMTSAYSSYSGCRQYRENVEAARQKIGEDAPTVDKLRVFYNHPNFVAVNADHLKSALAQFDDEKRDGVHVAFTAHSIPVAMAKTCDYVVQLEETARLVAESAGAGDHKLVFQSRSEPPSVPWLEPDISDHLEALKQDGVNDVIIAPIGFLSDHVEVLWDLDVEARDKSAKLGMKMVRAGTVGEDPRYISMIVELVKERMLQLGGKRSVGDRGPSHDVCAPDCCNYQPL